MHLDATPLLGGREAQVRDELPTRELHGVVVEVPSHRDEIGRRDHLVVAADPGAPLQLGREPSVLDADRYPQPLRVARAAGEGVECLLLVEGDLGGHGDPLLHGRLGQVLLGKVVGSLPTLTRSGEDRQDRLHRRAVGPVVAEVAVGAYSTSGFLGGFSILQADSADALKKQLEDHPHLMVEGNSIEVCEFLALPGME
jgi:hypothetical protein